MMNKLVGVAVSCGVILGAIGALGGCELSPKQAAPHAAPPQSSEKPWYEDEIRAFEEADKTNPPAPGQVLFTGSSSIRMWKTVHEDMAPVPVLSRGFGGSKTDEVIAVADRIVFPYKPSVIVYYCGDNDLGTWSTDSHAAADGFLAFASDVHRRLPETKVLYLAIKPSIARWSNWGAMQRANMLVKAYCDANDFAEYVDVATPLLGPDGSPAPRFFLEDGLHLNADGYAAWTEVVKPRVLEAWRSKAIGG